MDVERWLGPLEIVLNGGNFPVESPTSRLCQPVPRLLPNLFLGDLKTAQNIDLLRHHSIGALFDCSANASTLLPFARTDSGTDETGTGPETPAVVELGAAAALKRALLTESPAPVCHEWEPVRGNLSGPSGRLDLKQAAADLDRFIRANGVDAAGLAGRRMLLFCVSGVNRSPAVLIAYLLLFHKMALLDAILQLRSSVGRVIQLADLQTALVELAVSSDLLGRGDAWKDAVKAAESLEVKPPQWLEDWRSVGSSQLGPDDDYSSSDIAEDGLSDTAEAPRMQDLIEL